MMNECNKLNLLRLYRYKHNNANRNSLSFKLPGISEQLYFRSSHIHHVPEHYIFG
jgi:hypothetical protein